MDGATRNKGAMETFRTAQAGWLAQAVVATLLPLNSFAADAGSRRWPQANYEVEIVVAASPKRSVGLSMPAAT